MYAHKAKHVWFVLRVVLEEKPWCLKIKRARHIGCMNVLSRFNGKQFIG